MTRRLSIASRAVVCLVTALLVGAGMTGAVTTATASSGPILADSDIESFEDANETTESVSDPLEGTAVALENGTNETLAIEEPANESTDNAGESGNESANEADETAGEVGETVDESTDEAKETADEVDDTTTETATGLEGGTETATKTVTGSVTETTEEVDSTVDGTTDGIENTTAEPYGPLERITTGSVYAVGKLPEAVAATLEGGASGSVTATNDSTDANETAHGADTGGDGSSAPDTASTATDALLVGVLGAITVSGATAGVPVHPALPVVRAVSRRIGWAGRPAYDISDASARYFSGNSFRSSGTAGTTIRIPSRTTAVGRSTKRSWTTPAGISRR